MEIGGGGPWDIFTVEESAATVVIEEPRQPEEPLEPTPGLFEQAHIEPAQPVPAYRRQLNNNYDPEEIYNEAQGEFEHEWIGSNFVCGRRFRLSDWGSARVFLMQDFEKVGSEVRYYDKFVCVLVMKIVCSNGSFVIGCCSKCCSSSFRPYMNADYFLTQFTPQFQLHRLFGCRHTTSAAIDLARIFAVGEEELCNPSILNVILSDCLSTAPLNHLYKPGWLFSDSIGTHSHGAIAIFFTLELSFFVYSLYRAHPQAKLSFYCHVCTSNNNGCSHVKSAYVVRDDLPDGLVSAVQTARERENQDENYTAPLFPFHSKKVYPLDFKDCAKLQEVISLRLEHGLKWFIPAHGHSDFSVTAADGRLEIYPEEICDCIGEGGKYKVVSRNAILIHTFAVGQPFHTFPYEIRTLTQNLLGNGKI